MWADTAQINKKLTVHCTPSHFFFFFFFQAPLYLAYLLWNSKEFDARIAFGGVRETHKLVICGIGHYSQKYLVQLCKPDNSVLKSPGARGRNVFLCLSYSSLIPCFGPTFGFQDYEVLGIKPDPLVFKAQTRNLISYLPVPRLLAFLSYSLPYSGITLPTCALALRPVLVNDCWNKLKYNTNNFYRN